MEVVGKLVMEGKELPASDELIRLLKAALKRNKAAFVADAKKSVT